MPWGFTAKSGKIKQPVEKVLFVLRAPQHERLLNAVLHTPVTLRFSKGGQSVFQEA